MTHLHHLLGHPAHLPSLGRCRESIVARLPRTCLLARPEGLGRRGGGGSENRLATARGTNPLATNCRSPLIPACHTPRGISAWRRMEESVRLWLVRIRSRASRKHRHALHTILTAQGLACSGDVRAGSRRTAGDARIGDRDGRMPRRKRVDVAVGIHFLCRAVARRIRGGVGTSAYIDPDTTGRRPRRTGDRYPRNGRDVRGNASPASRRGRSRDTRFPPGGCPGIQWRTRG